MALETVQRKVQQRKEQLALGLTCNASRKTVVCDRYMSYPLSVSPVFRLDGDTPRQQRRAYLYRMNTSPGLLANDTLAMSVALAANSELSLLDQAATKVHAMPDQQQARVDYTINVESDATLEFLPEPLILFADAALTQTTEITMASTAGLSLGEIVVPGRLARGERYQFREYLSRIKIRDMAGNPWFVENMKLLGRSNRFVNSELFASADVLGTLLLVIPEALAIAPTLTQLSHEIEQFGSPSFDLACSVLPGNRGLFVRAIAQTTGEMRTGFRAALGCVRSLRNQPCMPYSV